MSGSKAKIIRKRDIAQTRAVEDVSWEREGWVQDVEEAVRDAREAIEAVPGKSQYIELQNYPRGSCGIVAHTIGHVLSDRGLLTGEGEWMLVHADSQNGSTHMWLEYLVSGRPVYSIDQTISQWPSLALLPWSGKGPSPARARFTARPPVPLNEIKDKPSYVTMSAWSETGLSL